MRTKKKKKSNLVFHFISKRVDYSTIKFLVFLKVSSSNFEIKIKLEIIIEWKSNKNI